MNKILMLLGFVVTGVAVNVMAAPLPVFCTTAKTTVTMHDDSGASAFAFVESSGGVLYLGNTDNSGDSTQFTCGILSGFATLGFDGYSLPAVAVQGNAYDNVDISLENQDSGSNSPSQMCANNIQEAKKAGGGGTAYQVGFNTQGEPVCISITGYDND